MNPRVSIVLTSYNYGRFLGRAIESVWAQGLPQDQRELIVVDDGSTDETPRVLERYRDSAKIIRQENRGLAAAANAGVFAASAPLVIRLDADDEFTDDCLSVLVPVLEANETLAFVYGDRWEIRGPEWQPTLHPVATGNIYDLIAPGILFRRRCLLEVGLYRPLYWEEHDLMIRLLQRYPGRHFNHPVYKYYLHGENMTANADARRRGWKQLVDEWGLEELTRWGTCNELEECSR